MQMEANIGGPPSSCVGQLRHTGLYTPAVDGRLFLRERIEDGEENMLENEEPGLELWK